MFITIEACADGTITRANARALNRTLARHGAPTYSGVTLVADVIAFLDDTDASVPDYRVVYAAALVGADKAAHTREVTRSRKAQARRAVAKAELVAAQQAEIDRHAARRPMPFPRSA